MLAAALAMFGNDLVSTWLVQAESEYRAHLAGLLDMAAWPLGLLVNYTAIEAFHGHDARLKVAVVVAVSVANYLGTRTAVRIGKRLRKREPARCCAHCPGATR